MGLRGADVLRLWRGSPAVGSDPTPGFSRSRGVPIYICTLIQNFPQGNRSSGLLYNSFNSPPDSSSGLILLLSFPLLLIEERNRGGKPNERNSMTPEEKAKAKERQEAIRDGIRMEREKTIRLLTSPQYRHLPAEDAAMVIHNGIHWGDL